MAEFFNEVEVLEVETPIGEDYANGSNIEDAIPDEDEDDNVDQEWNEDEEEDDDFEDEDEDEVEL